MRQIYTRDQDTRGQELQSITLYSRYTNRFTGQVKLMRRVLSRAIFRDERGTIVLTTGSVPATPIFIWLYDEPGISYLPPAEWQALADATPIMDIEEVLAPYYTIETGGTVNTVMINHVVNNEYPIGTSAQASSAEVELLRIQVSRRAQSVTDNRRSIAGKRANYIYVNA